MRHITLFSVPPRRRAGVSGGLLAAILLAALPFVSAADAAAQGTPLVILQSIVVRADGDHVVVEIEADGPLPMPSTGRLDGPPRFFLDFPGVITGTRGPGTGLAPVTRVRVALNSSNPPVTRVVLDLSRQHEIEIDGAAREAGRIRILVGAPLGESAAPAPAPAGDRPDTAPQTSAPLPAGLPLQSGAVLAPGLLPVPALPLPRAPTSAAQPGAQRSAADTGEAEAGSAAPERPATSTTRPPAASPPEDLPPPRVYGLGSGNAPGKPSEGDLDEYRARVRGALARLRGLRPLLAELDAQPASLPDGLQAARTELSGIIRALRAVRPSDTLRGTHDMLMRSASLSLMAVTLRADAGTRADPTAVGNAGSAAAGALLLLDRVCIEIGCEPLPEQKQKSGTAGLGKPAARDTLSSSTPG